jgi:hypothetical protein
MDTMKSRRIAAQGSKRKKTHLRFFLQRFEKGFCRNCPLWMPAHPDKEIYQRV